MTGNKYPSKLLKDAVEAIGSLPGVGSRSALRLALHLLGQPSGNVHHFTSAIDRLADEVKYCRVCNMISDDDTCPICSDARRDHTQICVVESVRDVMSIEDTGQYHGVYHVLGGIISPINGIAPSDLAIPALLDSGDVEGETTSFYIYRQIASLGRNDLKVTTLARGLGFGDDLEYADSLTLGRSILGRHEFRP